MAIDWGELIAAGGGAYDAYMNTGQDATEKPYMVRGQKEGLIDAVDASRGQFANGPQSYYGGNTVAGLDQNYIDGQNAKLGTTDRLNQMGDLSGTAAGTLASGGAPRVGGFQMQDQIGFGIPKEYQDAIMNPIMDNLHERTLPALNTAATAQGAFGGSRAAQQKSDAATQATTAATNAMIQGNLQARGQSIGQRAGDISGQLQGRGQDINQNQLYNQALNQGVNATGTAMNQQLIPGQVQEDVGTQRTGYEQKQIDADKARFDWQNQEDIGYIDRLMSRMGGTPTRGATVEGQGATLTDILAGAGTGANLYNSIFNNQTTGTR